MREATLVTLFLRPEPNLKFGLFYFPSARDTIHATSRSSGIGAGVATS